MWQSLKMPLIDLKKLEPSPTLSLAGGADRAGGDGDRDIGLEPVGEVRPDPGAEFTGDGVCEPDLEPVALAAGAIA